MRVRVGQPVLYRLYSSLSFLIYFITIVSHHFCLEVAFASSPDENLIVINCLLCRALWQREGFCDHSYLGNSTLGKPIL